MPTTSRIFTFSLLHAVSGRRIKVHAGTGNAKLQTCQMCQQPLCSLALREISVGRSGSKNMLFKASKQPMGQSSRSRAVMPKEVGQALERAALKPESKREPVLHVAGGLVLCVGIVASGILDDVQTEIGFEYYAEPIVPQLPAILAMPANCLVNVAYVLLGWYWLPSCDKKGQTFYYFQEVFALMALAYGPVQWVRLWTQHHWAAILDQWLTLPIFAWVVVWCHFLEQGWKPTAFLAMEVTSLMSYTLALLHPQGFELALGGHIFIVVWRAWKLQRHLGNATSFHIMALGVVSCLGFVSLKLWDQELAQWALFQRLTGHFWSKICDVLQFHCAFLFLTQLSRQQLRSL